MNDNRHIEILTSWKGKLVCVLFSCVLLFFVEITARIFFKNNDALSSTLDVLEQDKFLFWRVKPYLNTSFQGVLVKTNSQGFRVNSDWVNSKKKDNTFRVVCLGASPTFGWGVTVEEAYPFQLQEFLREKNKNQQNVEVINAGVIGYTSYQGVNFFTREILPLAPDVITVSYVVNDVDKYRFYRSGNFEDKELLPGNAFVIFLENIFQKSRAFAVLKKTILTDNKERYYANIEALCFRKRRVACDDYRRNLEEIIYRAHQNNIKVILVKMMIASPFSKEEKSDCDVQALTPYGKNSIGNIKNQNYHEAMKMIKIMLKYQPYTSTGWYCMCFYYQHKKNFTAAQKYFKKASMMELWECVCLSRQYNQIMQEVGERNNVPVVDVSCVFRQLMQEQNESLFVNPGHDFVHPNAKGHRIIAQLIENVFERDKGFVSNCH